MTIRSIKDLAATVKTARKNKGLTQQELAEISGTGRRFIVELESGKKESLSLGTALRVINRLGLRLNLLSPDKSRSKTV